MSSLKYSGITHLLELVDSKGTNLGRWTAYNNIDSQFAKKNYQSLTHLKNGVYLMKDTSGPYFHTPDAEGSYGLYGIIRFYYPGHDGVGVHSGRAHSKRMPGPQHATHGCIRTTDEAMLAIEQAIKTDPLSTISIVGNSEAIAKHGTSKHQHGGHGGVHP